MRILISGASIAGPVLAYWLTRRGFDVTVVERAPALRKTGGHAVDLFRPAMEISERMGVLPRIEEHATGTTVLNAFRPWATKPARIDYLRLIGAVSDRHVEIMRDDLSTIYYDAGRHDAEYVFGDEITAIGDDGHVEFRHGAPRRFDLVVGADGLHSGVRRIVFGDEVPERFLGGYLAVVSVPKSFAREGEMDGYFEPDRVAMAYTADHLDDARAVFIFRPRQPLDYDHRDVARQQGQLCTAFAGMSEPVDRWLAGSRAHSGVLLRRHHPTRADQLVAGSGHARRGRRLLSGPRGRGQHQPRRVRRIRASGRNRQGWRRSRGCVRRIRGHDDAVGARRPFVRQGEFEDARAW